MVEVLRLSAEHRVLINLVATTHCCAAHDAHVRIDYAVVADNHVVLDVCERIDRNVLAYLRIGTYMGFFTYIAHDFNFLIL